MSRGLSPEFIAALSAGVVRPALFFYGAFVGGELRLWTGLGSVSAMGQTWIGAGHLLGVSQIEDQTAVVASSVTISLSGVPDEYGALVLNEVNQGAPGRLFLGLMSEDGALITDPVLLFDGRIDVPEIADGDDMCLISLTCESRLAALTTACEWRYTHESQQVLYPSDRAFEYVAALQDKTITWGRK